MRSDLFNRLQQECEDCMRDSPRNEADIPRGRVAPAIESLSIGQAKEFSACVLFVDIRGFTSRFGSDSMEVRLAALRTLNAVIPVISRIVVELNGYVEKNTGDGVMAIFGVDESSEEAIDKAGAAAMGIFLALSQIINPTLRRYGIDPVNVRIGVDYGPVLISRIGVHSGRASHARNFLTAIGLTANLACKMQGLAETNEVWVGDHVARRLAVSFPAIRLFERFPENWQWVYSATQQRYRVWRWGVPWLTV